MLSETNHFLNKYIYISIYYYNIIYAYIYYYYYYIIHAYICKHICSQKEEQCIIPVTVLPIHHQWPHYSCNWAHKTFAQTVHYLPKCMSYHEIICRLVITRSVHCFSFWLHIYCAHYSVRFKHIWQRYKRFFFSIRTYKKGILVWATPMFIAKLNYFR